MLKLKLQYFGYLTWRAASLEQTLILGKIEGGTRMGRQRTVGWHHWLNGHEFGWTPGVGDGQGGLACCSSWGRKESDTNWTEYTSYQYHVWLAYLKTVLNWLKHKMMIWLAILYGQGYKLPTCVLQVTVIWRTGLPGACVSWPVWMARTSVLAEYRSVLERWLYKN